MFAPLLASLVGGMGLVAAVLRREKVRPVMTFRPPRTSGPSPRRAGVGSPGSTSWARSDRVGRRHRRGGAGPAAPPDDLGFFTQAERAVAEPLLDLLLAQDGEPRVPVLALIDTRLAIGETDGWHYDDLPEDGQAWRDTLAVPRPRTPSIGTAPVRRGSTGEQAALIQARAGPRRTRGRAVARLPRHAGVEPVDPVRLHRVLLPPVGVERDRLPRPRLPPRLPEPRHQRPRALGSRRPGATRPGALRRPRGTGAPRHADLAGRPAGPADGGR